MHWTKASPVYPGLHAQFGVCDTTRHRALTPQEPGQGSLHFWLIQAKLSAHSLLLIHSGLQFGGLPMNSGKQVQTGASLTVLQIELAPQGDGRQGLRGGAGSFSTKKIR